MNAVITGATRGMGRAISAALAKSGYNLVFCSRKPAEVEEWVRELRALYPSVQIAGIPADCSDRASLQQFANFVQEQFTVTDVLVNNAGMFIPSDILTEEDDILDRQLALNLFAPYYLSKVFGNKMKAQRSGHIVNICSVASLSAVPGAGSYSISKYALLGLTSSLREELAGSNVKVTAILPGSTLTSSWDGAIVDQHDFIASEDIAAAVMACLNMSAGACPEQVVIRPMNSY